MSGRTIARTLGLSLSLIGFTACSPANTNPKLVSGNVNAGIIGGELATGTEDFAKSIVMLYDTKLGALCTASIISDKLLITAAHCVASEAKYLAVLFGTDIQGTELIARRVAAYSTTPVWTARQFQTLNNGDMALVGFAGGLPAGYAPARMLGDISKLTDGQTVTLAGYGTSDGIADTGSGKLRFVDTTIKAVAYSDSEVLMEQSKGKGACHGDSGGPAYVEIEGKRLLIGVTSRGVDDPVEHFGVKAEQCGVAAAYTSIAFYAQWILSEAKVLSTAVDAYVPPVPVKRPQDPSNVKTNSPGTIASAR